MGMKAWSLRLRRSASVHRTMPSLEETFAAPSEADRRHLLPLLRLDLSQLRGADDWPEVAYVVSYTPGFVYWLYWSPGTGTFTQIDAHD